MPARSTFGFGSVRRLHAQCGWIHDWVEGLTPKEGCFQPKKNKNGEQIPLCEACKLGVDISFRRGRGGGRGLGLHVRLLGSVLVSR